MYKIHLWGIGFLLGHVNSLEFITPVLTTWKNWTNWKSVTVLALSENWCHRANWQWCPKNWRERQIKKITVYQEQNAMGARKEEENFRRSCVWTSLTVKDFWGPSLRPLPHLLCILPLGAPPGSHSEDQRKIPSCFQQGKGKTNHFAICLGKYSFWSMPLFSPFPKNTKGNY